MVDLTHSANNRTEVGHDKKGVILDSRGVRGSRWTPFPVVTREIELFPAVKAAISLRRFGIDLGKSVIATRAAIVRLHAGPFF